MILIVTTGVRYCAPSGKKTIIPIYIVVPRAINAFAFNFAHEASSREVEFTRAVSLFRLSIVLVNYQWNVRATRHPEGSRMRPPGPATAGTTGDVNRARTQ